MSWCSMDSQQNINRVVRLLWQGNVSQQHFVWAVQVRQGDCKMQ